MPDGDGIEVMMRVRRVSRGVRLIGVSGAGGDLEGLWFRAMRAMGAVDVLQKPLDRQALLALLASPDGAGAALPRLSA
jgi:FixJ family two-component response regulator